MKTYDKLERLNLSALKFPLTRYIVSDVYKNFKFNPEKTIMENKLDYFQQIVERINQNPQEHDCRMISFYTKCIENIKRILQGA